MMLGYVHNTTKIWRIWDFNSGKTGRAVECSSVVFDEKEDAFTSPMGERSEVIEFPEEPQESHEVEEMNVERMDDSLDVQENSKFCFPSPLAFGIAERKKRLPFIQLDCWRRGNLVIPVKKKKKKKTAFLFAGRKRLPLTQLECWRRGNLRTAEISRYALGEGGRESPPRFGVDKSTLK
jgi:hypothetical protein